jgi:pyruvate/2-oxoglutarate/acetoin dehydrogenase E1 component
MTQAVDSLRGTVAEAIRGAQDHLLATNSRVVLLGESVGRLGGIHGTSAGLLEAHGPDRVCDLPLSEAGLVGYALGLAMSGAVPIVELSGPDRVPALLDQLANEAATLHKRTRGEFQVSMVVRIPCGGGVGGGPFLEANPAGLLSTIEGLAVVSPTSAQEAAGLLLAAVNASGPVVILEPQRLYRDRGYWQMTATNLTGARVVRDGDDCTVLAHGGGVSLALQAAEQLWNQESVDVEVVDLRSLSPLDVACVGTSIRKTGHVILATDGSDPGLEHLLRTATDTAFLSLESPPQAVPLSQDGVDALVSSVLDSTLY